MIAHFADATSAGAYNLFLIQDTTAGEFPRQAYMQTDSSKTSLEERPAKDRSIVISVRVPQRVKEDLELESDKTGVTLNSLISQILTRHTKWDVFAKEGGFGSFPKQVLTSMLEKVDDEALIKLAHTAGKSSLRDVMIFMRGELTIDAFVETLDLWLESANIQYRRKEKGDGYQYVIMHMLGPRWSLYVAEVVSAFLTHLGYKAVEISKEKDMLSFTIAKPR